MDALKAEINRKRKLNDDLRQKLGGSAESTSGSSLAGQRKFIRAGDRMRMQVLELQDKQKKLDADRLEQQRKREEEEEARRVEFERVRSNSSSNGNNNKQLHTKQSQQLQQQGQHQRGMNSDSGIEDGNRRDFVEHYATLNTTQLKIRLRSLGQPVTLFGESESERRQRLIESIRRGDGVEFNEYRVGHSARKEELEEAELEAEDIADKRRTNRDNSADREGNRDHTGPGQSKTQRMAGNSSDDKVDNNNDDDDDDDDDYAAGGRGSKDDTSNNSNSKKTRTLEWDPTVHFSEIAGLAPEKIVYKFFRAVSKQWESDLDQREDWVKRTAKGKMETKTQKQCKDHIRPLFRMCKKKEVLQDILDKLVLMVQYCEQGNFLAANDQYIQTAIGKSAWPIGLTMVGIHERSGREKISTSKVAHIMNNELERKYLTSVKRLMTYAQSKRPDVAPSMKVLNT